MDNIVIIAGDELYGLLATCKRAAESDTIYRLRVCVDGDGAKFKFNESVWSPPYGRIEQRQPRLYSVSDTDRQSVGAPGHCERCTEVGHVLAHPGLGCSDVGCHLEHEDIGDY